MQIRCRPYSASRVSGERKVDDKKHRLSRAKHAFADTFG